MHVNIGIVSVVEKDWRAPRRTVPTAGRARIISAQTILYTAGYRDAETDRRLPPEQFYASLPPEAVTVDIRSHPYSPFAPAYTGSGVQRAVEQWKPGEKTFYHVRELGNTRKDASGKRLSPPIYVDAEAGFERLEAILREHGSATIFCACSYATHAGSVHRCHRFFVADSLAARMPELQVIHWEAHEQA